MNITKKKDISHFKILDWDFSDEDSVMYIHNFCWYPSRFIPIIPAYLIQALSKPGETVFDPFCGSGTTLIEALKQNRNAIGIDLSPVGCFISNTKGKIVIGEHVDTKKIEELKDYIFQLSSHWDKLEAGLFLELKGENIPNREINQKWYHSNTLKMLGHIFYFIEELLEGLTRDICRVFFISILMPSSGYQSKKPYGYYADNVIPKNDKIDKNALKMLYHKLNKFLKEYKTSRIASADLQFSVINNDARYLSKYINNKVDLIVTSPPYLNVTDYTTGFRLAYLWYDFLVKDFNEMENLKRKEIGARWRRKQRTRLNDYFNDMQNALAEMNKVLKESGYLCLVLGEPKKYFTQLRENIASYITENLHLEFIESFDRNISKKFFIHPEGGGVHNEGILIFRK
jgi:DNA modification methylase